DDYCIRAAGEAADRLVRILKRDFDISSVMVYFTGHRGFHIIASCEYCYYLTKEERAEIARYIAAEDLQVDMIIPTSPGNEPLVPSPEDPGWRGWLGRELMRRVDAVLLKDNKARRGRLQPTLKDALGSKWRERIVETIRRISVPIDMQVTQDTSRLVRIPGSLNGKTGLIVTPVEDPLQFRLSREVSPIRGEAVVKFQEDVEIDSLMGKSLSFKAGEEASVEAGIALILASKGLVDFVEVHGVVETHPRWRAL
ncbi:MAG: hypothetical protein LRS46_00410, partial [Desulfurococcales archaeon]|nr:hypothetical protein [Desulfurococcales archaeon]